jgi:hypothetical protein
MNRARPASPSATVLWASAFVIAAMTIIQAGRLPGPAAHAGNAAAFNEYSLVTARSGIGPDEKPYELLYVIDSHAEVLLVYEIQNIQQGLFLRDGGSLVNLFRSGGR